MPCSLSLRRARPRGWRSRARDRRPHARRAAECVVGVCVIGKALARVESNAAEYSLTRAARTAGRVRAGDEVAQRLERAGHRAQRARLDEHVAERRRLDRAGEHGQSGAVGGALAEQLVERRRRRRCGSCARRRRRCGPPRARPPANAWASDSTMLRAYSARVRGAAIAVLGAPRVDAARACRPAARKRGIVDVEDGHRREVTSSAESSSVGRSIGSPCALPRAHGLAQHPQPHDVVQAAARARRRRPRS